LFAAIRTVAEGDALLSPQATRALVSHFIARRTTVPAASPASLVGLTKREREAVALLALGLSDQDIATELVVSPYTVATHVHRAMTKLGVRDRAQLAVIAYQARLVRAVSDYG
jgi:DNA-binding NarL/FixJ family response regulator